MVASPQEVQRRNERRSQLSTEQRHQEAIEQIADALVDIKSELMALNRNIVSATTNKNPLGRG